MPLFEHAQKGGGEGGGEPEPRVFRVAEVNRAVRMQLEDGWRDVWIEGELSDVKRVGAGHVYFTLSDSEEPAQLRGVIFQSDARRAKANLETGEKVRFRGTLSVFEPRGTYQLIARIALPAGVGDLHAQFERLRKKLEAEGLLRPERKRPLPAFPRVIGLVTSLTGAAMHDVLRLAAERFPVRIVVADCRVQGPEAPSSIVAALSAIARLDGLGVVIVARGGGSQEELWAFNDERVARAIAACPVPVVNAVGHEVDVTIADLVADVRAATPSNAAEIVVPDRRAVIERHEGLSRALEQAFEGQLGRERLRLERLLSRLRDPRHLFGPARNELNHLRTMLERGTLLSLRRNRAALADVDAQLNRFHPRAMIAHDRQSLAGPAARLVPAIQGHLVRRRAEIQALAGRLDMLSPLAVLSRGYAIGIHESTGKALLRASDARAGDTVHLRLHEGSLKTRVEPS